MNDYGLNSFLASHGIAPCSEETISKLTSFAELLENKNRDMNLIANGESKVIMSRHIADSLMFFAEDIKGGKLIDIGCGGGFPGIPIKIYADGANIPLSLVALDATAKKTAFIAEAIKALGLHDAEICTGRAEEEIKTIGRESFDYAVSRAVADMRILVELSLPYLKTGGMFTAWKSSKATDELNNARKMITLLGGEYSADIKYSLPEAEAEFILKTVRKTSSTPKEYPRRWAAMKKG